MAAGRGTLARAHRAAALTAIACAIALGSPGVAAAHPLHTSLAELVHEPSTRTVRISLRVFVDDFTTASHAHLRWLASRQPPVSPPPSQSPYVTYALAAFKIADTKGKLIPLTSCGGKRSGELMWLCFRAPAARGLSGLNVRSHILFDMYRDQINIVQAAYGGRRTSLLFTRGDRVKKLP